MFAQINNYLKMDLPKFIYYNFFCKQVVRKGRGKIIPYRNAAIDLAQTAKIELYDGDILLGANKLKGSHAETRLRLRENAIWTAVGEAEISYGCTIDLLAGAKLQTKYFTMNVFSVLIAAKEIDMENDVMIARNVTILDSDHHEIAISGKEQSKSASVHIGEHVWIGAGSTVLKGTTLGNGCVIGAGTIIKKDVPARCIAATVQEQIVLKKDVDWKR